jgi:eukaryotic-like serine/threonine-protein kinase
MSQQMSLERLITDWMADEARGVPADQLVNQIITTTRRERPRPRWLAILQESPMHAQARVVVGTPTRRPILAVALLALAALVVAGVAGAYLLLQPKPAADNWPGFRGDAARNGLAVRGPIGNPVVDWQFHADGSIRHAIAISGDVALAPSDDGVLHALGVEDGAERWSFTATAPMRAPFTAGDKVYVADGAGVIHAVMLSSGDAVWTSATPLNGPSELTVVGSKLYVGTSDGNVVGIDITTGAETWRQSLSPGSRAIHAPAATESTVVVATDDRYLAALDAATGEIRWRIETGDFDTGTPVIHGDVAYVGSGSENVANGQLVAYDLATGAERWRINAIHGSPVVVGNVGYTGSVAGLATAIDLATGTELWRTTFDSNLRAPAVAGDIVYLAYDGDRAVVALDRATGGRLWEYRLDGPNECCIAVARGRVFVGTSAGTVYAIGGDGAALVAATPGTGAPTPAIATTSPEAEATLPPLETSLVWASNSGDDGFIPWDLEQAPDGQLWTSEGFEDRFAIFTEDGEFVETWGSTGTGDGEFDMTRANGDPYGRVAFASDGSFYVLDAGNRRIQAFDSDRTFIRSWGSFGSSSGKFSDPVGIVVDGDGNIHVLDDERAVIETFDVQGNVIASVRAFPGLPLGSTANDLMMGPNGHFYVSVVQPNLVLEVDREGNFVANYGARGSGEGAFGEQPMAMGFDADGRLYVSQGPTRGDRFGVLVFDVDGTYLGGFGPLGSGESELGFPFGLVVTDDGIYASDAGGLPDFGFTSLIRKFEPVTFP